MSEQERPGGITRRTLIKASAIGSLALATSGLAQPFLSRNETTTATVREEGTMLKTISPLISPQLLKVLAEMGHGDEIIFSDAHFPAHSMGPQVIRADGLLVSDMLAAIMPLFELDSYSPPLVMMAAVKGDTLDPAVEARYLKALALPKPVEVQRIDRFAFYDRAKTAFAIVITGERAKYGNILLKKGVIPS